jgi:hypothetical protein
MADGERLNLPLCFSFEFYLALQFVLAIRK